MSKHYGYGDRGFSIVDDSPPVAVEVPKHVSDMTVAELEAAGTRAFIEAQRQWEALNRVSELGKHLSEAECLSFKAGDNLRARSTGNIGGAETVTFASQTIIFAVIALIVVLGLIVLLGGSADGSHVSAPKPTVRVTEWSTVHIVTTQPVVQTLPPPTPVYVTTTNSVVSGSGASFCTYQVPVGAASYSIIQGQYILGEATIGNEMQETIRAGQSIQFNFVNRGPELHACT